MNWKIWTLVGAILLAWIWIFAQFREAEPPLLDTGGLRRNVGQNARSLLLSQNFVELEKELERLRKEKARMPDGSWQLPIFFNGLYAPAGRAEDGWTAMEEALNAWEQAFPVSAPAKIARAGFLRNSSEWERRQTRDLPEPERRERRKVTDETIGAAADLADSAMAASPPWPEAFRIRMEIAGSQGMPFDQRKALVERAAKAEPSYYDYYYSLLWAYNPQRRNGSPDKLTLIQYADWCQSIAGSEGKNVYARLAAATNRWYEDDFFAASGFSWPKVRDGFKDIVGKYPKSVRLLNQYCRLACLGGDRKLARNLFEKIGQDRDFEAWKNQEDWERWRTWSGAKNQGS